jgi:hypothetical protein
MCKDKGAKNADDYTSKTSLSFWVLTFIPYPSLHRLFHRLLLRVSMTRSHLHTLVRCSITELYIVRGRVLQPEYKC